MFKQKQNYGCGVYSIANALNFEEFITDDRIQASKKHGNTIGQLSKWLQEDGRDMYVDSLYYNHLGKRLPSTCLNYHPMDPGAVLPVMFNVQYSEKGLRHMVGGKIDYDKALYLYDSLADDVEVTTVSKLNNKFYRVFGFFIFMYVDTGDYVVLR